MIGLLDTGNRKAINWNVLEDTLDKLTWEKLTSQFWLDTRIPVSNDLDDWRIMSEAEKEVVWKVLGGLTMLDTIQSVDGISSIIGDAVTQHEEAVLNNIQFMESVHAKSYSTIFSTLMTKSETEMVFNWVDSNEFLQNKNEKLMEMYDTDNPLKKKATSVMLESFLFYSGFYAPLYFLGQGRLANVAEIIKLIIKDESVHGTYIGYKFQIGMQKLSEEEQEELKDWVYENLMEFYENEVEFTRSVYDPVGLTEDVLTFLEYNANKALANLGLDQLFPTSASDVDPVIMNGLSGSSANHDFFSQVGNSYHMGVVEATVEEDYSFEALSLEPSVPLELKDTSSKYVVQPMEDGTSRLVPNIHFNGLTGIDEKVK